MKKRVIVLGATGSIGKSALDVISNYPDLFEAVALHAHSGLGPLMESAAAHSVKTVCLSGAAKSDTRVEYQGREGLLAMIRETDADMVLNGIAGASGLEPSVAALESGKDLALANKETMVMAGALVNAIAARNGRRILPVDSEHSAVFHLLEAHGRARVEEVILTASGGAFRDMDVSGLAHVTIADALKHPTWSMGKKITIDSATMANKGLEVIEAVRLFGIPRERVKVLIHPESRVHALIRLTDGSLYAEISRSDMRLPIQDALTWPDLKPCTPARLDLSGASLTFRDPDPAKYPLLPLAYACADPDGSMAAAYNAANEVAVEYFLSGTLAYLDIAEVVAETLRGVDNLVPESIPEVLLIDAATRKAARVIADRICATLERP